MSILYISELGDAAATLPANSSFFAARKSFATRGLRKLTGATGIDGVVFASSCSIPFELEGNFV